MMLRVPWEALCMFISHRMSAPLFFSFLRYLFAFFYFLCTDLNMTITYWIGVSLLLMIAGKYSLCSFKNLLAINLMLMLVRYYLYYAKVSSWICAHILKTERSFLSYSLIQRMHFFLLRQLFVYGWPSHLCVILYINC